MGTVDSPSSVKAGFYGDSSTGEVSLLDLQRNTFVDFKDTRQHSLHTREFQDPTNFIRSKIGRTLHLRSANHSPVSPPRRTYDSSQREEKFIRSNQKNAACAGDSKSMPFQYSEIPGAHINIGGTAVKLRNPRRSPTMASRNAKAMSWLEQPVRRVNIESNQRRHSNIPRNSSVAETLKKLDERKNFIETERKKNVDRRNYIEEEKKLKENLWLKELSQFQQELDVALCSPSDATSIPHSAVGNTCRMSSVTSTHASMVSVASVNNNNNNEHFVNDEQIGRTSMPVMLGSGSLTIQNSTERSAYDERSPIVGYEQNASQNPQPSELLLTSPVSPQLLVTPSPSMKAPINTVKPSPVLPDSNSSKSVIGNLHTNTHSLRPDKSPSSSMPTFSVSSPGSKIQHHKYSRPDLEENIRNEANNDATESVSESLRNKTYVMPSATDFAHPHHSRSYLETYMSDASTQVATEDTQNNGVVTYKVPDTVPRNSNDIPVVIPENVNAGCKILIHESHQSDTGVLQPLKSEPLTRRTLFPSPGVEDSDGSVEQENIDPNHCAGGTTLLSTYDSFAGKLAGIGSNQSTPHKSGSPSLEEITTTPERNKDNNDENSALLKTADRNRKGGEGFDLVDATPNTVMAKKKEMFLLKQLKKEEELKRKRADREREEEKRKEEARIKQEEINAKREEEKLKRQQILDEYKKRKLQQEESQRQREVGGIIASGVAKKQPKMPGTRQPQNSKKGQLYPTSLAGSMSNVSEAGTASHSVVDGGSNSLKSMKTRRLSGNGRLDWETESASSSAVSSDYTGPKLYKEPSLKSNKHIIHNAICHCCLPGKVNEPTRQNAIQVLDMCEARHFMILFRDSKCQFRALYTYDPETEKLHRLLGNGPGTITPSMIERLYKYNSGRKAFAPLPSKTLSVSIDAVTIKNSLWQSSKKANSSKK